MSCSTICSVDLIKLQLLLVYGEESMCKTNGNTEEWKRYVPCLLTTQYPLLPFFHLTESSNKFQLTQTTFLLAYIFFVLYSFLVTLGQLNSISGVRKQNKYFSSSKIFFSVPFVLLLTCYYTPIFSFLCLFSSSCILFFIIFFQKQKRTLY